MKRLLHSAFLLALLAVGAAQAQVSVDATKTGGSAPFAGTFTWAGKPTCDTGLNGAAARISDVGIAPGLRIVCDGSNWRPAGVQVLARSAVAVSVTGTLTKTALVTVAVPAGLLGTNGGLRITAGLSHTNSANNKVMSVEYGSSTARTFTRTTTAAQGFNLLVQNRGSATSQVSTAILDGLNTVTTGLTTDSSAAQNLTINGTLASTGETITLEDYVVEVLP